jgi:hypothetical protein
MPVKSRVKGETFRPMVSVLKEKNGVPTKVKFNGVEYALVHADYINGGKSRVRKG